MTKKCNMVWFRVRMNSSKMTRVQKAGILSNGFNGRSKKGTDKNRTNTLRATYTVWAKAESTVKPTFKYLWQICNACVEKKQAMAESMAEEKQYLKVPNRKMGCKSTERSKKRNHTNEKVMKKDIFLGSPKTRQCIPNSTDARDQHLLINICMQTPRSSCQRRKKRLLKAWVSKRTWQDYRHRSTVVRLL